MIGDIFKFSVRGFSPKRMGYLLDVVSAGFIPVHMYVSCEQSSGILGFAFLEMLGVLILCLFTRRSEKDRFGPFVFGFILFLVHTFSAH